MSNLKNKNKRRKRIITLILILSIMVGACAIYLSDYYHADRDEIVVFSSMNNITAKTLEDDTIIYEPEDATAGFIFYPGGKVEYTAYTPLMQACASEGILCALVEMPFNLAVLDVNAADGIQEMYPEIEEWYIGGHSLGGSMAASYLADYADAYEGLILLGSYSTADLSDTELSVLSIYGSEDGVMNQEKYNSNKSNLPNDFKEVVIEGGCHAYFGMYGAQDGDGTPTITNEEQIEFTVQEIMTMIR